MKNFLCFFHASPKAGRLRSGIVSICHITSLPSLPIVENALRREMGASVFVEKVGGVRAVCE